MKVNSFRKQVSMNYQQQVNGHHEVYPFVINDLQQTIDGHTYLGGRLNCRCDLCQKRFLRGKEPQDGNLFRTNSKQSAFWLKKILDGLCLSGARTLKFHLPDILFIEGDNLEIFQSNRKDGRLIKLTNSISLKSMYPTAVRLRRQYKNILEETFNQKMLEQIDPQFMHIKYFDKFVPPYFHDGHHNQILQENKSHFRRYILHKNKKYEIQQIQQHKMNDKQPFCLVKYTDGNCQLFNQREFEVYSLSLPSRLQQQLVYVQSYIKYKLEAEAIYFSEYTLGPSSIDHDVDNRAQKQTIALIGGGGKHDAEYKDIETYDQLSQEMMISQPHEYVKLMTYKIVHYLSMTSRIYIDHIKIKWIMNDIGNIYLQEVMEFQMSQIPRRLIKYRLPPKDQTLQFYHQNHKFVQLYRQLKRRKTVNTHIIKKSIAEKTYQEIMQMIDPDVKPNPKILPQDFIDPNLFTKHMRRDAANTASLLAPQTKGNEINKQIKPKISVKVKSHKYIRENNKRQNSVSLDKWRNIGLANKKEQISQKIKNCFIIKIPDEAINVANKTIAVTSLHKSSRSTGKCRLRYAAEDQQKESTTISYFNTISTLKSVKTNQHGPKRSMSQARKIDFKGV